jgi:hypothetical protein
VSIPKRPLAGVATLALAATVGAVAFATPASAATRLLVDKYTSVCSDSPTRSVGEAYCTVAAAVAAVQPGERIDIIGRYDEHVTIAKSGTPDNPITLKGYNSGLTGTGIGITIDGQHDVSVVNVQLIGVSEQPAVSIRNSSRITLDHVSVQYDRAPSWTTAFALSGVSDSRLVGVSAQLVGTGIALDASTSGVAISSPTLRGKGASNSGISILGSHNTVTGAHVYDFGGSQVDLGSSAADNVIANGQLTLRARGGGIRNAGARNTAIVNNTVVGCTFAIQVEGSSTGVSVQNNVVLDPPANAACADTDPRIGIGVLDQAVEDTVVDYNSTQDTMARPYAWGSPLTTLADFRAMSGQGTHDATFASWQDATIIDAGNSNAPGAPATDALGRMRADNPDIPNTGAGPVTYADRGATEWVQGPTARLTTRANRADLSVVADASAATPSWLPTTYTFAFGDGTTVAQSSPIATHRYALVGNYTVTVTLSDGNGTSSTATASAALGGAAYTAVGPVRVLDTRSKIGATTTTPVGAHKSITLQLPGVPTSGLRAVVLNVTATQAKNGGVLTVYPAGSSVPTTSNVNFSAGKSVANAVTVQASGGKVSFYNNSAGTVHVVADLAGYYSDAAGSLYNPLAPARVLDTRSKIGVGTTTAVPAHGTVRLQVAGRGGVPTSGATAAVLNVTVNRGSTGGVLTAYPDGATRPSSSALNWSTGQTIANLVTVPLVNGWVDFYNNSSGTVHVIADVAGYYAGTGAVFWALPPWRFMDTRTGMEARTLAARGTARLNLDSVTVPGPLRAVVLNVTATRGTANGYAIVYPDGTARPATSTLNWPAGRSVPNLAIVRTTNGKVDFYNASDGKVDFVADLFGYFTS